MVRSEILSCNHVVRPSEIAKDVRYSDAVFAVNKKEMWDSD